MCRSAGVKRSERHSKMKVLNDEEIARLSLPELIELLCRIAEEIELRAMELAGELADGKDDQEWKM